MPVTIIMIIIRNSIITDLFTITIVAEIIIGIIDSKFNLMCGMFVRIIFDVTANFKSIPFVVKLFDNW